jgi:hypothetical protein
MLHVGRRTPRHAHFRKAIDDEQVEARADRRTSWQPLCIIESTAHSNTPKARKEFMRLLIGLLLGIVITVAAIWFFGRDGERRGDATGTLGRAGEQLREGADDVLGRVREGIRDIGTDGIRDRVQEGSRKMSDASGDAVITGKVKAEFARDSQLSVWKIGVNTTDGRVTLSGSVPSQSEADRAVELAGNVEGVREVISTLQVQEP